MQMFPYIALVLSQVGITLKMFAMKMCGKRAGGAFNSVCINTLRAAICLAVSILVWLIAGGEGTTWLGHLIILLSGLGTAVNLFTWILATRAVSLTLLEITCMIGSMLVPMALAPHLFGGEQVALHQWLGGVLVLIGAVLFIQKDTDGVRDGTPFYKAMITVSCALSVTAATLGKKLYSVHIEAKGLGSAEYFTFMSFVVVVAFFAILFAVFYQKERRMLRSTGAADARVELPYGRVWHLVLLAALSLYACELLTVYANRLPAAVYLPLSKGLNIGCTFLLDVLVFKDKVNARKLIALATVMLAVVIVNL